MKSFFLIILLVAAACSAPLADPEISDIISLVNVNDGLGPYNYGYQTSNGIQAQQQAVLLDPKDPNSPVVVTGFYSYTGTDGVVYRVDYVADENGYRAKESQQGGPQRFG